MYRVLSGRLAPYKTLLFTFFWEMVNYGYTPHNWCITLSINNFNSSKIEIHNVQKPFNLSQKKSSPKSKAIHNKYTLLVEHYEKYEWAALFRQYSSVTIFSFSKPIYVTLFLFVHLHQSRKIRVHCPFCSCCSDFTGNNRSERNADTVHIQNTFFRNTLAQNCCWICKLNVKNNGKTSNVSPTNSYEHMITVPIITITILVCGFVTRFFRLRNIFHLDIWFCFGFTSPSCSQCMFGQSKEISIIFVIRRNAESL